MFIGMERRLLIRITSFFNHRIPTANESSRTSFLVVSSTEQSHVWCKYESTCTTAVPELISRKYILVEPLEAVICRHMWHARFTTDCFLNPKSTGNVIGSQVSGEIVLSRSQLVTDCCPSCLAMRHNCVRNHFSFQTWFCLLSFLYMAIREPVSMLDMFLFVVNATETLS